MGGTARRVLAIDAAFAACSVAVLADGDVAGQRFEAMTRGHAERLLPMVREVMAAAGFGFETLDLIAVTIGPGHFTGLRVGLSAAQGLSLALDRPLAGVTTLEAVAAASAVDEPLAVALESKRADLYLQVFKGGQALTEAASTLPERLAAFPWPEGEIALAGDGAARLAPILAFAGRRWRRVGPDLPDAATVARIATSRQGTIAARAAEPLYLRPPDVTLPKERAR
ncbi:MAG: tRNA (adenosine(37)-N6)-threonylcarbamoyltransferase complex dimerization subunit type 1 TsaB [Alphaproteobacteria bacterium]|nr:tRNA (adenosine(37)-N6)-threonylcarbamoyltransferase complex dimerization subunit type 1 TsaB [Alphaproteobacteria bacterium]